MFTKKRMKDKIIMEILSCSLRIESLNNEIEKLSNMKEWLKSPSFQNTLNDEILKNKYMIKTEQLIIEDLTNLLSNI